MSPFVGEIRIFCGNFAPAQWALCNGQIMAISQNTQLFSLLGTQFGGNGTSNFALPNLQDSIPVGQGNGPGLTPRAVLDKFAAIQMLDVHFPTTDGRTLILSRYTELNADLKLLAHQLRLTLPPQPPPRITAAQAPAPLPTVAM